VIQDNPNSWGPGFYGSEHPDTARLRVKKEYVETMISLKRENMDRIFDYLNGLMDKGKEELAMARTGNNEHRRAMLRQHVDEIIAYLKGQSLDVEIPAVHDDGPMQGQYQLDGISGFFGRVRCVLDQWYDSHLMSVYDEIVILVNPKKKVVQAD
jgi:hypothetical protein